MEKKTITFGKRKITRVNYSNGIYLPKIMLENMGVSADDYLEFITDSDGTYHIKPVKGGKCKKKLENGVEADAEEAV